MSKPFIHLILFKGKSLEQIILLYRSYRVLKYDYFTDRMRYIQDNKRKAKIKIKCLWFHFKKSITATREFIILTYYNFWSFRRCLTYNQNGKKINHKDFFCETQIPTTLQETLDYDLQSMFSLKFLEVSDPKLYNSWLLHCCPFLSERNKKQ